MHVGTWKESISPSISRCPSFPLNNLFTTASINVIGFNSVDLAELYVLFNSIKNYIKPDNNSLLNIFFLIFNECEFVIHLLYYSFNAY